MQDLDLKTPSGKAVWTPLEPMEGAPMSAQEFFLRSEEFGVNEVLFTGTTANGKTDCLVVHPLLTCGLGHGAKAKYVFVKPTHAAMKDIINKTKLLYPKIDPGAKFYNSKGEQHWVMSTGEEIWFLLLDSEETYNNSIHGSNWLKIYFDELGTFSNFKLYELMKTRLRFANSDPNLPDILPQILSTTNPWGGIFPDVHRYFMSDADYSEIVETTIHKKIRGEMKEITTRKMTVFGSWEENHHLEDTYIAQFEDWKETNPTMYETLVLGKPNVSHEGFFDGIWDEDAVVLPDDLILPANGGIIDCALDWGYKKPYSIGYYYECNGESLGKVRGKDFCPPKGSIIYFAELYGGSIDAIDTGSKEDAREVAERQKAFENDVLTHYIKGDFEIKGGVADTQLWAENGKATKDGSVSMADDFEAVGIYYDKCDKGAGSRAVGLAEFIKMINASKKNKEDVPHFYVVGKRRCRYFLNTIPSLQTDDRNPDDVKGVDHVMDQVRYRLRHVRKIFSTGGLFGGKGKRKNKGNKRFS